MVGRWVPADHRSSRPSGQSRGGGARHSLGPIGAADQLWIARPCDRRPQSRRRRLVVSLQDCSRAAGATFFSSARAACGRLADECAGVLQSTCCPAHGGHGDGRASGRAWHVNRVEALSFRAAPKSRRRCSPVSAGRLARAVVGSTMRRAARVRPEPRWCGKVWVSSRSRRARSSPPARTPAEQAAREFSSALGVRA